AGAGGGVRLRAVSAATTARSRDPERNLSRRSRRHLCEVDLHVRGEVRSPRARRTPSDAEEVVAEERREEVGQAAEVERAGLESAAAETCVAEAVVQATPLRVREDFVRLDDLAEAVFRVGRLGD